MCAVGIRVGTPGDCAELNWLVHGVCWGACTSEATTGNSPTGASTGSMHGLSAVDKGWVTGDYGPWCVHGVL